MRNRNIIEEIIKTCDDFRGEISKNYLYLLMNFQQENSKDVEEMMNDSFNDYLKN